MKNEKWFRLSPEEIEQKLKTNAATGLSRKAARSRAQKNTGSLFVLPRQSPYKMLGDVFADFALILLLFAAIVSLFFDEVRNGATVLILTLGNLALIAILSYRSQRTMESMTVLFYPTVRVVRGGRLFCVDFRSVAVGDVMLLEAGDVICCDGRLVTSDGLRVRMRVDREHYQSMNKFAEGHVNSNEHRASEMVNMVHAGSVVEAGSARVIITAVGRYTYLGAMTGGIEVPFLDELPHKLTGLRKLSKKINIALLLAVIPLSFFSLLVSYFSGGTVLLSAVFLTALSLVATTASHLTLVFARVFYVNRIRKLATKSRIAAIRSIETACRLADTDYLFAVDGSLLTDGHLHFHQAVCAEGIVRNYGDTNPTAKYFSEMVSLYRSAATRTLTTGVSSTGDLLDGIGEFIKLSGVDEDALSIRCSCLSYGAGNLLDSPEQVCISDRDRRIWLHVSRSADLLRECGCAMMGGEKRNLNEEGRNRLLSMWSKAIASHQIPIVFTYCLDISFSEHCFLGMLLLKEGVDEAFVKNRELLRHAGCRMILFSPASSNVPPIPSEILEQGFVSKHLFSKHNKPLTHHFGKIAGYTDFEKEDIIGLIEEVRAHGYRVLVCGMSEDAAQIAEAADGFISCASMRSYVSGYLDEEIQTFEVTGERSSASSAQAVKLKADVLVARPSYGTGGLVSLSQVILDTKTLTKNLSGFLNYLLWMQVLRMIVLTVPMLFGQWFLDARHLLLCSCVLDVFAFFSFLEAKDQILGKADVGMFGQRRLRDVMLTDQGLMVATVVASLSVLILPWILDVLDFAGKYLYPREFSFVALLFLHWSVLFAIRFGRAESRWRSMLRDTAFLLETLFIVAFLALAFLWQPFGILFLLEKNPLPYLVLSLVPSVLFLLISLFLYSKQRNAN
ncbi:MAG: cation-transporting P-type ATPase [Clostridia bacterium]|nr:cation-transporting P-type ATPase [Clostridia bacterium]